MISTLKTVGVAVGISLLLLGCTATSTKHQQALVSAEGISPSINNIKGHMSFLAHDLLEGRDTGSRGHEIASLYIQNEFEKYGLKPAGENGTFQQRVKFRKGLLDIESPTMVLTANDSEIELKFPDDFLTGPNLGNADVSLTAPVVFVGYGIVAPELNHDDYAGLDVEGKIVVALSGKPASFPSEVGSHLSSRTQKHAAAADRGAVAYFSIQTPAGEERRPYARSINFIRAPRMSWVDEEGVPGNGRKEIQATAFLSIDAAHSLFSGSDTSLDDVYAQLANNETPKGFDLDYKVSIEYKTNHEDITSPNVIGLLEGSDPELKNEYVVYTAHSDHLGISTSVEKDKINNGAMDNASGTSVLIETARMFSELSVAPKRSILFVAVTGEEKGLLGADYFVRNPTRPVESLIANVNLDMPLLTYEFADVIAFGASHSSMGEKVAAAVANADIKLTDDPWPQLNLFTRSDHYAFVKQGIPAVFLVTGIESRTPGIDGNEVLNKFLASNYHRPSDDMSQPFVWKAAQTFTQVNFEIGLTLGNDPERPTWNKDSFFGQTFGRK
ncbi:M28 family metallopeptidase [Glaciecola petra]|uniref:M28 family metallopeptidase n=1 Tax=Glaciecola petra TaxID=3075602 RepID=A0ABU2ZW03_9ALTE|nr:M28 family metallopeptidase [Aestuariibacter sp. P117]MDT0596426.1 M28 family metallopeptidase [Aestuariibacter sp. P117]